MSHCSFKLDEQKLTRESVLPSTFASTANITWKKIRTIELLAALVCIAVDMLKFPRKRTHPPAPSGPPSRDCTFGIYSILGLGFWDLLDLTVLVVPRQTRALSRV